MCLVAFAARRQWLLRVRHCPLTRAAYDEPMADTAPLGSARLVRWSLWLGAGVVSGLTIGFAIGLAKPRIRR